MTQTALIKQNQFQIVSYQAADAEAWDALVAQSPMATFLHSRRFLTYHGDRFEDRSLMVRNADGELIAVFPAAVDPGNSSCIISHPGSTYGGLIHAGALAGEESVAALSAMAEYYRREGFETLRYKVVPEMYHQRPAGDDRYALFRLNAVRYRCDLSATLDLRNRPSETRHHVRDQKTALRKGVVIAEGVAYAEALWEVLAENLTRKHQSRPVHSLAEILELHQRFPDNIDFVVGLLDGVVVGGAVLFNSAQVSHLQYLASSQEGYQICALDALLAHCIEKTAARGLAYFDFGHSNERDGQYLNVGLFRFKGKFGATGAIYEFYELALK